MPSGQDLPEDTYDVVDPDQLDERRRPTLTEFDRLEPELAIDPDAEVPDPLEDLALDELREGETDDPDVAAEEGIPWIPPIDPPVVASTWSDDPIVAAGTGVSALDEDYEASGELLSDEGELNERIREALRADSATSSLADTLVIAVVGSTAVIGGVVDDIGDGDAIVEVAQRVDGIDDVRDETEVPGI
jgi:hypothetical protein